MPAQTKGLGGRPLQRLPIPRQIPARHYPAQCGLIAGLHPSHLQRIRNIPRTIASAPPDRSQVPVMCSGRTGTRCSGNPVASRIAATMAGPEEMVGGSPTPRRP